MSTLITGTEARKLIEEHDGILVDVRNPPEFSNGSAPGAVNIPVHLIPHKANELDSSKPVIVFCVSGARSAQAQMILHSMGFDSVKSVGGLQNYLNS